VDGGGVARAGVRAYFTVGSSGVAAKETGWGGADDAPLASTARSAFHLRDALDAREISGVVRVE
jgi:hypothetical protein